jgi:hypothetical protein
MTAPEVLAIGLVLTFAPAIAWALIGGRASSDDQEKRQ